MSAETIPRAWLRRKTTLAEIERTSLAQIAELRRTTPGFDVPHIPFGLENQKWRDFRDACWPGDEIWEFESPPELWEKGQGRVGYVAMRGGRSGVLVASLISGGAEQRS